MNRKLLSIVIPTKNRYEYLKVLLVAIDSFNNEDVELIIQDNSDDNEGFIEFLKDANFKSDIKYFYTRENIPIYLNSDKAILNSTGKYVCFIGDDDGITKHIIDCVKWMDSNEVDVVIPEAISYQWPDFINSIGRFNGKLNFKQFTNTVEYLDPKEVLDELLERGCIDRGRLPLLYHGIACRDKLDEIYNICGSFFPGASPDIANGIALSLTIDKYAVVSAPIIISGASRQHGGGVRALKHRAAKIEDVPFLPKDTAEKWDKRIPKIWTGATIWSQSAVSALIAMKRKDLVEKMNYEALYVNFSVYYFHYRSMAFKLTRNKFLLFIKIVQGVVIRYLNAAIRLFLNRLLKKDLNRTTITDVLDIKDAIHYFDKYNCRF